MNHNEIESCVIRAKNGSQEDLLKLLSQFKPFIYKTANQFNIRNFDTYDSLQIGYIAIINALGKYRTGSHTFSSYAFNSIKNAFRYTARQTSKYSEDLSLNLPVDSEENVCTEFIDCIEDSVNIEEDVIRLEKIKEVRNALSNLTEEELELVLMIFYSGLSLRDYSRSKRVSYVTAVKRKKKILEKLSSYVER